MIDNDVDAWLTYPTKRQFFNKLWFSDQQGYVCGPAGIPIPSTGEYVVRPIYNLHGMGVGASVIIFAEGPSNSVPPGYFWCEYFEGQQYTADFIWNGWGWDQTNTFEGVKEKHNLSKFKMWRRVDRKFDVPAVCRSQLAGINFNVEFIEDKPIEVHLRVSPDPIEFDEYIPVWDDNSSFQEKIDMIDHYKDNGYCWVESFDDGGGRLKRPRLGFWCKKYKK